MREYIYDAGSFGKWKIVRYAGEWQLFEQSGEGWLIHSTHPRKADALAKLNQICGITG